MFSLTDIVLKSAREQEFVDDAKAIHVLDFITSDCGEKSHIEHHLTHLGDLISIAERSHTSAIDIGGKRIEKAKLDDIHRCLIEKIADTVRWGYRPAVTDPEQEQQIGTAGASIVDISGHRRFVEAVFGPSRARSVVRFFTATAVVGCRTMARALDPLGFKRAGARLGVWLEYAHRGCSGMH